MTFSHIKNGFSKKQPGSAPEATFAPEATRVSERSAFARIALFALLVLPLLFASCSNLFDDVSSVIDNHNSSDGMNNLQHGEVVITGGIAVDSSKISGAVPAEMAYFGDIGTTATGRFAVPSLDTSNAEYTVTATAEGYSGTRSGEVNSSNKTFSISLALGYKWTITLEMKTRNADDSVTTKLKGTYTYSSALSESDVKTAINITLVPTTSGTGNIDLRINENGLADGHYDVVINSEPELNGWQNSSPNLGEGIQCNSLKSGVYDITLNFWNNGVIVYSTDQIINVFDNMTTNFWIGDGTDYSPITSDHEFNLTQPLLNIFKRTNFYVSASGSNTDGDGSSVAPYATVSKVLSVIGNGDSSSKYVIRLLSDIQDKFIITDSVSAQSITIKGYGGNKTITYNGSSDVDNRTVRVETQSPVTLENITIDGAVTYPSGTDTSLGLVASSGTNVTLKNCTITKTNRDNGSAVWSQGTVTLEDCTITHCRSTGVTDTDTSYLIVNTQHGVLNLKNCTISGNTARCIVYNVSSAEQLKLDGNISIPASSSGDQRVSIKLAGDSTGSKITIGDNFSCSGNILLELPSYTPGTTVLVPETNGATSVVANAASKFTLTDGNYSIGTSGDDIGKLVLNPNIYVSSSASSPAGNDTTGDGSAAKPFASIQAAVNKISELNTAANYIIRVTGDVGCEAELSESTLGTAFTSSTTSTLTICGDNKATDKLKGSDAGGDNTKLLVVNCAKKVTIQNLTLYGLTSNGYAALQIDSESANVEVNNCDITGNTRTASNTNAKGGGIYCKGTLTLKNCNVTDNISKQTGGGIYCGGSSVVTIEDCTIQNNTSDGSGGGIFVNTNATLNVKGYINITENKWHHTQDGNQIITTQNVFLDGGKITVAGALSENSTIGVFTVEKPTATTPVTFTSGFGANCSGVDPNTVFESDEEYMILTGTAANGGEAYLAASGGNINTTLDYNVTLSCANTVLVAPGSVIKVSAAVTKNGTAVSPAPTADDITWGFTLLCGGDVIATIPSSTYPAATFITTGAGYASLTIPTDLQIYDGLPYTLHAVATYKDTPAKDADIALTGSTLGFVSVTGTTTSTVVRNGTLTSTVFNGNSVTIPDLFVCDHEVTQGEFFAVMQSNPSQFQGDSNPPAPGEIQENRPVEKVSWYAAIVYCNKRSIKDGLTPCYSIDGKTNPGEWTGMPTSNNDTPWNVDCNFEANGYRLPTDAEWEYLARGGSPLSTDKYAGTDSEDDVYDYAWFYENSNEIDGVRKTHEVKKKLPNSLGLYDMSGNVSEWCWDWNEQENQRLDRSAHWNHPLESQYSRYIYANYSNFPWDNRFNDLGIRVVRKR